MCRPMTVALDDPRVPVAYLPNLREYALLVDGGPELQVIEHCPWCGAALPPSLRDEFFERLEAMGLDPEDSAVPLQFRSDAWWRRPAS
jgi:hypothetical protein